MTAIIQSIQQVTITISAGSASGTATISSVTTGNAVIWNQEFVSADTGNLFGQFFAGVQLTNSTTVTATRGLSASTSALTVYCTVVEFVASAITSIQTGTISMVNVASNTATISSVTTSRAVAFLNGWTNNSTDNFPGREFCAVTLTNATTVTANRGVNPANTAVAYYTIVEFASGITQSVQQFATTLNTTGTAITQTITSVTTGNSCIVMGGFTISGTSTVNATDILYTAELSSATQVTLTRIGSNNTNSRIYYYTVLEFASGILNSSVQRGLVALTSQTSNTATVTSVNTTYSFVNWAGFKMGLSSVPVGTNFSSLALTAATTVTARMNTSNATANTQSYEVLEFSSAAAATINSWYPSQAYEVNPFAGAAQFSTTANKIQPSPINQTDWYAFNKPEISPPAPAAQYTHVAQKILPSPITQNNFYPIYENRVRAPLSNNICFSTNVITLIAVTITPNNWYPAYDAQTKPYLRNIANTYFAELLVSPTVINKFYPAYSAEIKRSPLIGGNYTTPPILAIATPVNPTNWYPTYPQQVSPAALAQCGTVTQVFPLVTPTPTPVTPVGNPGKHKKKSRAYEMRRIDSLYEYQKKLQGQLALAEDEEDEDLLLSSIF